MLRVTQSETSGGSGYVRRTLRPEAFAYGQSMLGLGRTVGAALRQRLTPDHASAWTLAAPDVPEVDINAYRGRVGTALRVPWSAYVAVIDNERRRRGTTFVVPDAMVLTAELEHYPLDTEVLTVGDEVLYVVRPGQAGTEAAWDQAGSAAGEMALLTAAPVPSSGATSDDLQRLADAAVFVVVSAYDTTTKAIFFEFASV